MFEPRSILLFLALGLGLISSSIASSPRRPAVCVVSIVLDILFQPNCLERDILYLCLNNIQLDWHPISHQESRLCLRVRGWRNRCAQQLKWSYPQTYAKIYWRAWAFLRVELAKKKENKLQTLPDTNTLLRHNIQLIQDAAVPNQRRISHSPSHQSPSIGTWWPIGTCTSLRKIWSGNSSRGWVYSGNCWEKP